MLFNSHAFLFFFLPLALAGYYALPIRWRSAWLVTTSYFFYGWWDWRYCGLLLLVTSIDYLSGARVAAAATPHAARRWVALSVVCDLSLLGFFKYWDLLASAANGLLGAFGPAAPHVPLFHILLPVGISFYVFQAMSYTIDIYRHQARPARSFLDFACYVSLFPQLVAGPIVRYRDLDSQLRAAPRPTAATAAAGTALFVLGLAKKVLLADGVAPLADAAFAAPAPAFAAAWSGLLAYTLQIYFDFSGYSDMAVGLGLLLGFRFPVNFDSPYKSRSITEFWRRWHISLSSWLRDYLYIPLGGNRHGSRRTYFNLWLTMLLGGLWHGASWTFVCWGAWHGLWLALERARGKRAWFDRAPAAVQVFCTFLLVALGWVFFRAPDFASAGHYFLGLSGVHGLGALPTPGETPLLPWLVLASATAIAFLAPNTWKLSRRPTLRLSIALSLLFGICLTVLLSNASSPFLYFQF
jgi:alginate O-acetyltransferase complex protein AlgI